MNKKNNKRKGSNRKFNKRSSKPADKRKDIDLKAKFKKIETKVQNGVFIFTSNLTIQEFADKLKKPPAEIIKHLFLKGITCNLNTLLNEEQIGELCLEFGYDFKKEQQIDEDNFLDNLVLDDEEDKLVPRAPIVTIMGHVDHGKTTLLDTIKKTNVASTEAGSITQSIGAYQVSWNDKLITFFDTPGHEAFSHMRAVGADLTDIVVIVVAADDGLKQQTEEAINHAFHAKVPIIVFVNKIDKPNINIEKIYAQLAEKNLTPEEWGGKTMVLKGSAVTKQGIDELLEAILLTADLMELKSNEERVPNGVVIEAALSKTDGPVADILVQNGTLNLNDSLLIGNHYGKIRKMLDHTGQSIVTAKPSTPVRVSGLSGVPNSGDKWIVIRDEKTLKELVNKRQSNYKEKRLSLLNANQLKTSNTEELKEFNIILKTDNYGSLQALLGLLNSFENESIKLNIIHSAVGSISETDINLAKAAKGVIYLFNLKTSNQVAEYATSMGIQVKNYNIIYEIKEDIERVLKGLKDPVFVEKDLGKVEVLQLWTHSSIGTIAGCKVISGLIKRNAMVRIFQNKEQLEKTYKISSLKHGKETIASASAGKECGFTLEGFNSLNVGDVLEVYELVKQD